jgi:hypothetical protein
MRVAIGKGHSDEKSIVLGGIEHRSRAYHSEVLLYGPHWELHSSLDQHLPRPGTPLQL